MNGLFPIIRRARRPLLPLESLPVATLNPLPSPPENKAAEEKPDVPKKSVAIPKATKPSEF